MALQTGTISAGFIVEKHVFALPAEKQFEELKQKLETSAINFLKKTPDILTSIISSMHQKRMKFRMKCLNLLRKN